jgi:Cu2+-exporting ATPase
MLAVAALTGLAWGFLEPARALPATLAVLAATCPCALALAVPAAIAAAQAAFARQGALVLDPDAIETLARVDTVVFDKTGTLTTGQPRLAGVEVIHGSRGDSLAVAAALERGMRHPLAGVFGAHDDGRSVTAPRAVVGQGIEGEIDGFRRRIGTRAFATGQAGDDEGVWLGDGCRAIARFDCADAVRPGAAEAMAALAARGLMLEVLSGDAAARVSALAAGLGIVHQRSRCTPAAKLAHVGKLRAAGRCVAMVGDGVNDAAVLAGADVAVALADGSALAQASASVVVAGRDLARLPALFDTACRARRVLRQNLGWAIAYNAVALPLAALGLVAPWLASLGMAASSLVVTLNALRLARPAAPGAAPRGTSNTVLSEAAA